MKRIGILFGSENTFPAAFVDRVNTKKEDGVAAEFAKIDEIVPGEPSRYAVLVDRISHTVPLFRPYLKNAAVTGSTVVNNPFWWSMDDRFLNNVVALQMGIPTPRTVLLPSKDHPPNTSEASLRNLAYPLNWNRVFDHVGFPAYLKPYSEGRPERVHRVTNSEEFFEVYHRTGQVVMMLQQEIRHTEYFRCFCLDRREVRIMPYDPRQPLELRHARTPRPLPSALEERIKQTVLALNRALGYDFNAVEIAVRDGEPFAVDFFDPVPDVDYNSVGPENFEWVVEAAARMTIRMARERAGRALNPEWGDFLSRRLSKRPPPGTGEA